MIPQSNNLTYELVRYEPALKQQVINLQCHLWSPDEALNTAYFEWKYERNPYVHAPLIYLAMHRGRAVGMRGFFGVQWEGGNPSQKLTALYADDLVVAPDHRNHGLVFKIMAAAFDDLAQTDYQYVFNLSAGPMTFLSSLATGWRSVGSMEPMCHRSLQTSWRGRKRQLASRLPLLARAAKAILRLRPPKRQPSLADLGTSLIRRGVTGSPWIIVDDVPRSAAMAQLVQKIGTNGRIRHVRDQEYFNWRFQNPLSRYRFLYWEKNRLEGYLVLHQYTSAFSDKTVVNIVDWEATNIAVRAELLRAAQKLTEGRNLCIYSVSLPQNVVDVLVEARFQLEAQPQSASHRRHALLVRPTHNVNLNDNISFAGSSLLDVNSWDLRMLYSMCG